MVHTNLIAITYLITDHDIDRLLDSDCLADRESRGVVHTLPIAIACRGPHQPDCVYIPVADHYLDRLLDRDRLPDRVFLLHRLIANVYFPIPITLNP